MKERLPDKHNDLFDVVNYAQMNTAAAGEARMKGMNVTIMAIAGSGNHGITNFLGVLSVAESLGCTREQTARALAISSMITIYIKGYVKRMTAFCGCGVAASTAIQFAYLAMEGCHIPKRVGIIGPTIEKTFENMGRLNNPGMVETDKVLVSIVQANKN